MVKLGPLGVCECTCRCKIENVFVFVCVSVAPEPVQADSWPAVSGSDQEKDNAKVRPGSLRGSVCLSVCAFGSCPHKKCLVAAHVQSFPSKQLFCVCTP